MTSYRMPAMETKQQLLAWERDKDKSICRKSLLPKYPTRFAALGAHDPTPTHYFILHELFSGFDLNEDSHLLDVGCATGRVLAYFIDQNLPGTATGIELDPDIAKRAKEWTVRYSNLSVIAGNALDVPLRRYTHIYLFNPFDTPVLEEFIRKIEDEIHHPLQLCHMSDNGENYSFLGRPSWQLEREGWIQNCGAFPVYEAPQHYSIWKFTPNAR